MVTVMPCSFFPETRVRELPAIDLNQGCVLSRYRSHLRRAADDDRAALGLKRLQLGLRIRRLRLHFLSLRVVEPLQRKKQGNCEPFDFSLHRF